MNFIKNPAVRKSALLVGLMTAAATASASTEGTEFQDLYNMLVGWSEGYLGKALAIAAFLTGAIVGFAKSTAMPALVGVVFAVVFSIGPGIIAGMMALAAAAAAIRPTRRADLRTAGLLMKFMSIAP